MSLGMSKSLLAFVWIAGPLTGTLVQPYIGIRSDNCRISWGKRKPFMIVGGIATVITLLALAWIKELVGGFLWIFGVEPTSNGAKTTIIVIATVLMYCVDIAINTGTAPSREFLESTNDMIDTVQAGIRCFIVDNAPPHQQETANAWASRLTGVGNILGYIFGYLDLPKYFAFLGHSQFQVFCALASVSLCVTLLISCLYIQERDPRLDGPPDVTETGVITFFRQVFKSVRHLPPEIAKVCEVQFAAWVGWFPFLFYSTTYIGQLYVNPIFEEHGDLPEDEINKVWEMATRVGTLALLVYAIISFIANVTLPVLVVPTYKKVAVPDSVSLEEHTDESSAARRTSQSSEASSRQGLASSASKNLEGNDGSSWLAKLQIPGLTLRRTWILSHLLFAICMFSTFLISTYQVGSVVIGLVGICWALTLWAPFALISAEVARIDAERRVRRHQAGIATARRPSTPSHHSTDDDLEDGPDPRVAKGTENDENLAQAGIVLGLHNVAVSAPQVFSSLICSGIFKLTQKPRGQPWDDSVGWVLRFGGCAALIAGWLATRLEKETRGVPV